MSFVIWALVCSLSFGVSMALGLFGIVVVVADGLPALLCDRWLVFGQVLAGGAFLASVSWAAVFGSRF